MLLEQLQAYDHTDYYPFHMPGHKRQLRLPADAYHLDITEIDGFDNLHHAQGILKEEQQKYADFVGVRRTFFLVNGSSCGILAAISAAVQRGGRLLLARNSHKAAYHALELRGLEAHYCYPLISDYDIQGAIRPETIADALEQDHSVQAVYITSPTYDGVVSDVRCIADIVHGYGLPLIVDEAHGAHFGLHGSCPRSATGCGADIVIQSVHKTLPAFTQSAVLHVCSDRIAEDVVERFLDIYESSSPSYLLMAGMSRLVPFLQENGARLFAELDDNLSWFYERSRQLRCLHVIQEQDFDRNCAYTRDRSKILISTRDCNIDGRQLYEMLLSRYHLQMEMCSGEYVTALCSLMDTREGFVRLWEALEEVDRQLEPHEQTQHGFVARIYRQREQACEIAAAMDAADRECVSWDAAVGRVSAEYVYLYPPGIPMLVPGERIDASFVADIRDLKSRGLDLEGMRDKEAVYIEVLESLLERGMREQ